MFVRPIEGLVIAGGLDFISYFGKGYACNPKYISEYLLDHYAGKFEIIWAFQHPEKFAFLNKKGIKTCKCRKPLYYFYRLTSGVVVHNSNIGAEAPIRSKQIYIQTWHGCGAYKKNKKQESGTWSWAMHGNATSKEKNRGCGRMYSYWR